MIRPQLKSTFGRPQTLAAVVAFVLALLGGAWLHHESVLHDTDAYFHLAVAKAYANGLDGAADGLPWVRLSIMHDGFGDKEWLFHVLLQPFARSGSPFGEDPVAGGRMALILAGALLAATFAFLAAPELGVWAALLPLWIFYASTETAWRFVRLRPELLALFLLLLAVDSMGRGRDRLLGVIAFVFTLSYTAFHVLPGLAGLVFLAQGLLTGRWKLKMPAYATLGGLAGLLAHPHFPKNLEVWLIQNVQFFASKGVLDVGTEIRPNTTDVLLLVNLGLFLGLAVLWSSSRAVDSDEAAITAEQVFDRTVALGVATAVFGGLYLLMSRFSIYFFPFATLFCLVELRRRGLRPGGPIRLPGGRRIPFAVAAVLVLVVSLPEAWRQLGNYRHRTDAGPDQARLVDREMLAAKLEPGARVAADWGPTATYMLWAPQALYLNALDPVFMATPYPEAHALLRAVLDGDAPDVPRAVAELVSDHLAFPTTRGEALVERLQGDPRVRLLHRGSHTLVRLTPAPPSFLLDWRDTETGNAWPRAENPETRAVEAFADAGRLGDEPCSELETNWTPKSENTALTFAPWGPSTLKLDGKPLVHIHDTPKAVLSRGLRIPLQTTIETHRLTVQTCKTGDDENKGFYLFEEAPQAPLP